MITTVLGIDYGKKRVGIAVGNTLTRSAEPLKIITRENDEQVLNEIGKLIKEWQATELAIGIPRHPDDAPHEMTKACLKFAQRLREELQLTVHETDERYSSAVLTTKNKRHANGNIRTAPQDDAAAAVILQQHLNDTH
jgi:putative Holliday junction resolvase